MFRRLLKNIIGKIIELIERYELRNVHVDESDISKKIIDSHRLDGVKVLSDSGYVEATEVHRTQPYTVYEIEFESGKRFECADNHIVFVRENGKSSQRFVKDIAKGTDVISISGVERVISVTKLPYKLCMYDITVNDSNHRYYTSDILSHNTTTIAAFISWMLIANVDKRCAIMANKEQTSLEIISKVLDVFKGLPFFLKPGTVNWGKTSVKLDNGCGLFGQATTNTASIGFTVHCMLLDEFAHIPENIVNNFWRSVYPTLSSSAVSQCIITSTPNGTTNKFYELYTGDNSFVKIRTDYWEVPGHDDAWAAKMKKDFGDEEFAQEFELQFNKNSKMLMKADAANFIERLATNFVHKPIHIQNQYLNDENLVWHPDFDPNNIDPMKRYIMIVDLAEGNEDADQYLNSKEKTPDANSINIFEMRLNSVANIRRYSNTSCKAEDCVRFVQVGRFTCNTEDEIYCARVCSALSYNLFRDHERDDVRVMLEMNFNGKSFFEEFRRHNCYSGATILKTFHKKPIPGEKNKRKPGFKTTQNKETYCIKGNKLLSKHRTVIRDKATFEQMKSFGYVRGKLKGIACHDDLSMPVFNHIPRMLDEQLFISWIQEFIYYNPDKYKVYQINELIKQWALDNPDMSDAAFAELYGLDDSDTTPLSMSIEYQQQTNPFSESNPFMNRDAGVDLSPYSSTYQGAFNPYSESGISGNTAFGFEVNRNILHY